MVIDEWPTEESFKEFFDSQKEIPEVMGAVAQGQREITFYRKLTTPDEF